ncbi:MAG TPA: aldehyde dehydrogenase (NADP(+)) [Abditibacterium sp.]|jgi:NADP-dependent aldehyde dehydrogenase
MPISGFSIVGTGVWPQTARGAQGETFRAFDPTQNLELEPVFTSATHDEVENAARLAREAFALTKNLSGAEKARFLRAIASGLEAAKAELIQWSNRETALPLGRVEGELGRTTSQLRLFADLVEEGSWVEARLDAGNPQRAPLPKPDLRSMLRPIGPVVVFGASNFPLAFSVAGGDTAAALAAGCPVIVKAHPAHPATSEIAGQVIAQAARDCELPEGIFSLLFDKGYTVGMALVSHPSVKAVGFTGSRRGGLALMAAAAARPEPIPVFAEMSSINPIFITPGALDERSSAIAKGLHGAVTQGVGQFCTNPGLILLPQGEAGDQFLSELAGLMKETPHGSMLTSGINSAYAEGVKKLSHTVSVTTHAQVEAPQHLSGAALFETSATALLESPELSEEVFGPSTLVVRYESLAELGALAQSLEGQLTATLQITELELADHAELVSILEEKAGRLLFNGFPTGVEVGHAMIHGGPFPATSDGQSTSVGTRAILRFVRPVCYQNFPEAALPAELQSANPLKLHRLMDGKWSG